MQAALKLVENTSMYVPHPDVKIEANKAQVLSTAFTVLDILKGEFDQIEKIVR